MSGGDHNQADQTVIHVHGFGAPPRRPGDLVSGVGATIVKGDLATVAEEAIEGMRSFGYEVTVSSVRTLDGILREVYAICPVDSDRPMWHRFLLPGDQWKRSPRGEVSS